MNIEILGELNLYYAMFLQICAVFLGSYLIGLNRSLKYKMTSIKDAVLVSFGAYLFTLIAVLHSGDYHTDRIIAQIVTGVGFLGAGVIFTDQKGYKHGITTAASIWCNAALGALIGIGQIYSGVVVSIIITIILFSGKRDFNKKKRE